MSVPVEAQNKELRIRLMLETLKCDSLIIMRRDNFAWLSCGGGAVVSHVVATSPVFLVVSPQKKYAVGYSMDLPRAMDEDLAGQGYEPILLPTFGKSVEEISLELATGRAAADDELDGAVNLGDQVVKLHEPYTSEEMERYQAIGVESGEVLREVAEWVEPGMTERQVLAHMWGMYLAHGFEGNCMFVGSDERIRRYRHPVPSDKPVEKAILLAPAISKWGLHVLNSRTVYFGNPPEDIQRRHLAVSTMQAAMVASSRPGVRLSSLLDLCLELFETLGYPEERNNHVHGGPTGYRVSYPERCRDPEAKVRENMALAWYLTVAGAKSEELLLVDEQGTRIWSVDPTWPKLQVEYKGNVVAVPDILIRGSKRIP
jgi:Xaa-Pro aminopeptidase